MTKSSFFIFSKNFLIFSKISFFNDKLFICAMIDINSTMHLLKLF